MNKAMVIRLPRPVLPTYYARARCPKHDVGVNEEAILFAGIGRTSSGSLCFAIEWQCLLCRKPHRVLLCDHPFNRPDWWVELVYWHDTAPPPAIANQSARRALPKIGPMVIDMAGLEGFWIRGGYKGDVGPIMLIYESAQPEPVAGVLRLERDSRFSLFHDTDPFCMPRHLIGRFSALADGDPFPLDGQTWTKMSVKEIKEIIRDRVFNVLTEDDVLRSTSRRPRRGAHGTNAPTGRKGTRRPPRDPRSMDS
jgi:hypothetical protein